MGASKVVYGGRTLVDLTKTTVTPDTLVKGYSAVNAAGETIQGNVNPTNLFFDTGSKVLELGSLTFAE